MKKIIALLLAVVMTATVVTGCGNKSADDKKIKIVTTIFPIYDWVRDIVGDSKEVEITMLLDKGSDLHSFQPTADDILTISNCDMFVYAGGESDEWVEDALEEKTNDKLEAVSLLDLLGNNKKEEAEKEGMEAEEECEDGEEETEYDEHVWLSLKNAKILTAEISKKLQKIDKGNAKKYEANEQTLTEKLDKLDKKYEEAVDAAKNKTLVFGDRFPFLYMTDDYGLDYYAAFKGCSAETEASFKTIKFLAGKIDELKLNNIVTIEGTDHKLAETIAKTTKSGKKNIYALDSMQAITAEDVKAGETYLGAMEKNLEVLKKALN